MHLRLLVLLLTLVGGGAYAYSDGYFFDRFTDTEPGFEARVPLISVEDTGVKFESGTSTPSILSLPAIPEPLSGGRIRWAQYWRDMNNEERRVYGEYERPPGPPRVGVQAGHWKLDEVPEELRGLTQSTGARGGGYTEQETVLVIAQRVKTLLEARGVQVDLLPATIPVDYAADAFVSIHADGSSSAAVSGFKISGPRKDFSGKADALVEALSASYGEATGLPRDANITRRMSGYYAFNWRRYDHALHPRTPAAIVETGFMTNAGDRAIIVSKPDVAARGIADGILEFLAIE